MLNPGPDPLHGAADPMVAAAADQAHRDQGAFSGGEVKTPPVPHPHPISASRRDIAPKRQPRKFLGDIKYRVVDRWPYAILRAYGNRRREHYRSETSRLPPLPVSDGRTDIEIHMLCGQAQVDMGIWASWSFMRFCPGSRLYVHSDGTLTPELFAQWQRIVPGSVLITDSEADEKFMSELGQSFPTLAKWRSDYWCAQQVIDYHLFGEAKSLVGMDSDILCFRRPREIEDVVREGQAFRWGRDLGDHYSVHRRFLESVIGLQAPEALNGGFLACPRFSVDDFAFLERTLKALAFASVDVCNWAMAQTLLAAVAARFAAAGPLPSSYDVTLGRTKADVVTRHYVGVWSVRPRFFVEGVPRLLRERPDGPLPVARSSASGGRS